MKRSLLYLGSGYGPATEFLSILLSLDFFKSCVFINYRFCTEKRFSDYVVRELTLTATKASITKAANGSDLDVKTTETRTVKHYHYLQWKDFNAPEHAPAMLRFVKRINEDHLKSR